MSLFLVVGMDETLTIAVLATDAVSRWIVASPGLHAATCLEARDHVGADGVIRAMTSCELVAVRVAPGQVEEIDSCEGDQEPAEKR